MGVTDADVRARVDTLLAEHGDDDEASFLGAQFDAGLARMDYPVGLGGLDASPKLQEIVDEALEAAGRRYPWMRNAMGIGMCGPTIVARGHTRAAGALPPADLHRRGDLVPAVQRTRRGIRRRRPLDTAPCPTATSGS